MNANNHDKDLKQQTRHAKVCSFTIEPELLEQLDNWRWAHRLNRSQALAQIIRQQLTDKSQ